MNTIQQKIDELQKRLDEIYETSGDDVHYSLREGAQTEEMTNMIQRQIAGLQEQLESESCLVKYTLSTESESLVITLIDSNPDPQKLFITKKSPLGQRLLELKVGDKIEFKHKEYEIVKVRYD